MNGTLEKLLEIVPEKILIGDNEYFFKFEKTEGVYICGYHSNGVYYHSACSGSPVDSMCELIKILIEESKHDKHIQ
jgi:hypothetical protein